MDLFTGDGRFCFQCWLSVNGITPEVLRVDFFVKFVELKVNLF